MPDIYRVRRVSSKIFWRSLLRITASWSPLRRNSTIPRLNSALRLHDSCFISASRPLTRVCSSRRNPLSSSALFNSLCSLAIVTPCCSICLRSKFVFLLAAKYGRSVIGKTTAARTVRWVKVRRGCGFGMSLPMGGTPTTSSNTRSVTIDYCFSIALVYKALDKAAGSVRADGRRREAVKC